MDESLNERSQKYTEKGHILYDSVYMKCSEQANPLKQKVDRWLPGSRERREWGMADNRYEFLLGAMTFWNQW